jgi:hypothetical protein
VTQAELLRYLVEVLDGLGLPYMVGGSHAAMYYGEPRLTRDVDIVVALTLLIRHMTGRGSRAGTGCLSRRGSTRTSRAPKTSSATS